MKILTFFLIVIIGLLIYLISEYKKEKKPFGDRLPWKKLLPEYIGKACEITVGPTREQVKPPPTPGKVGLAQSKST